MWKNFNDFNVYHEKNFFDKDVSEAIYRKIENLEFTLMSQERHGHYGHVFKSKDSKLPDDTETYAAQFRMVDERESSKTFNEKFETQVVQYLKKLFLSLRCFLRPNIMRIDRDCYFRAHNDAYVGEMGYTFFFSKGWKWDYGGLLTFINKNRAYPIFPENNSFLIRNEQAKPQHFVSPVFSWAKNRYYYLLVGWAASENQGASDVRGDYYDFG
jgi:hypothetical protein